jgi:hypothetical protein
MSWEDVALVIMGPRSNKTSALAVPAVLSAPGLVIATSNKADLWALTSGLRSETGPVWTFDPQEIAHAEQQWWWDPLRAVREASDAHRYEAASRLAAHFMGTIGGTRRDPFFHAAGEQVLVGTLLAAAVCGGSLRDVLQWLQYGRRDAITALDRVGAGIEAADLEASLAGADPPPSPVGSARVKRVECEPTGVRPIVMVLACSTQALTGVGAKLRSRRIEPRASTKTLGPRP